MPTPIGNLKDITLRALEVLKSVDVILCEDTRHSQKLLRHFEIKQPLISLHEHNERQRVPWVLAQLSEGKHLALISDAGAPLISDPGYPLVREVVSAGHVLEALPGPSAVMTALQLSGLPPDRFYFVGFLPNRSAPRRRKLEELEAHPSTLIFFESTHRIQKFLADAAEILGDRPVALLRELTKQFEEVTRGNLSDWTESLTPRSWKGEFVVVIGGQN